MVGSEVPTVTNRCHKILVRIAGIQAKTEPRTTQIQRSVTHYCVWVQLWYNHIKIILATQSAKNKRTTGHKLET